MDKTLIVRLQNMKTIITMLAWITIVATTAQADDKPDRLIINLGGFDGPSYELVLSNGVLWYKSGDYIFQLESRKAEPIQPSDEQWKNFRESLDQLDVWNWKTNYVDLKVLDGTQWGLTIAYSNRTMTIEGSNGYPGSKDAQPSDLFNNFLSAVEQLIGGKKFR